MKHFLLLLLFLIPSLAYSQDNAETPPSVELNLFANPMKRKPSIIKDKIAADGTRWVWGNYIYPNVRGATNNNCVNFRVVAIKLQNEAPNYMICFGFEEDYPIEINEKSPVLIKFGDYSTCQTENLYHKEDRIGTVINLRYSVTRYYIYAYINITDELLTGLRKGLKKIRFEINSDIYDVEPKKDNVSQFILDEYELIKSALAEERNFSEGF